MTTAPSRTSGSVVWSKKVGSWLIFSADDDGPYYYDPRGTRCYGVTEIEEAGIEEPARQAHVEAAQRLAQRYSAAITKAWSHINRVDIRNEGTALHYEGFEAALRFITHRMSESERDDA